MNKTAIVIIGSRNEEREMGLKAGTQVANGLRNRGWSIEEIDGGYPIRVINKIQNAKVGTVIVPIAYGVGGGEDGRFKTVADFYGIHCTGPTAAAGEISMNKNLFQTVVDGVFKDDPSVRTPQGRLITKAMTSVEITIAVGTVKLPMLIKPNYSGSSMGLTVANTLAEAESAVAMLLPTANAVLCQELIAPAEELSITILDREDGPHVFPIVGFHRDGAVYDYEQKFGATANDRHIIPAPISDSQAAKARAVALTLHRAIGACGLFRFDMLLTTNEQIVVLEVNSIPGLMTTSIACDAAKAAGLTFDELVEAYALTAFLRRVEAPLLPCNL
ncbi:MAG: ATP-grasp domain-containing protein [Verrucomicrobiota bacterium]|jgi:D-alanine-D-alanine ligase